MKEVADQMGVGHTFKLAPLGVYFGNGASVKSRDPFFGGVGPERDGCQQCGACMTGCRHNAKNSLDKNYLFLAEKLGAEVIAEQEVIDVVPIHETKGYHVSFKRSTKYFSKSKSLTAQHIIFAGGVLGTIPLLLKLK